MSYKTYINNSYGEEVYSHILKLQKTQVGAAIKKNQWIFMQKCLSNNILPKSFRTRPHLNTRKGRNITHDYNKRMLNATKNECYNKYHVLLRHIRQLQDTLRQKLNVDDFDKACEITEKSRESAYIKKQSALKLKYDSLNEKPTTHQGQQSNTVLKSAILNLTTHEISPVQ